MRVALQKKKSRLCLAKCSFDQDLTRKDTVGFWKTWQNIHGKTKEGFVRVNGKVKDEDIAYNFAQSFKRIYNDCDSQQAQFLHDKFDNAHSEYQRDCGGEDIGLYYLDWRDMQVIVSKLEKGKSLGSFIKAEHVISSSYKLLVHLLLLFNGL